MIIYLKGYLDVMSAEGIFELEVQIKTEIFMADVKGMEDLENLMYVHHTISIIKFLKNKC